MSNSYKFIKTFDFLIISGVIPISDVSMSFDCFTHCIIPRSNSFINISDYYSIDNFPIGNKPDNPKYHFSYSVYAHDLFNDGSFNN